MSACEVEYLDTFDMSERQLAEFPVVRSGLVIDYRPKGSRRWERLKSVGTRTLVYHQCWWFGTFTSEHGDYRVNRSTSINHPGRSAYA